MSPLPTGAPVLLPPAGSSPECVCMCVYVCVCGVGVVHNYGEVLMWRCIMYVHMCIYSKETVSEYTLGLSIMIARLRRH